MRISARGVSLLEALVSIGILALILGVLFGTYVAYGRLFLRTQAQDDLLAQTDLALRDIGGLADVSDGLLAQATINGKSYTSSSTTAVLSVPSIDGSGRPIPSAKDYAAVYRDPSNAARLLLTLQPSASSQRPVENKQLSDSLASVNFRYQSASATASTTLGIGLKLTKTVRNDVVTYVTDQTFTLGNK